MTKWTVTEAGRVFEEGVSARATIRASLEESSPYDEREPDDILAAYEAFIILRHEREKAKAAASPTSEASE